MMEDIISALLEVPKETDREGLAEFLGKFEYSIMKGPKPIEKEELLVYSICGPKERYEDLEGFTELEGYTLTADNTPEIYIG